MNEKTGPKGLPSSNVRSARLPRPGCSRFRLPPSLRRRRRRLPPILQPRRCPATRTPRQERLQRRAKSVKQIHFNFVCPCSLPHLLQLLVFARCRPDVKCTETLHVLAVGYVADGPEHFSRDVFQHSCHVDGHSVGETFGIRTWREKEFSQKLTTKTCVIPFFILRWTRPTGNFSPAWKERGFARCRGILWVEGGMISAQ